MNKVLVSCDEYVYLFKGKYYLREFGTVLCNRYLTVFDNLRLVVRVKKINEELDLGIFNIPLNDSRIEIYAIPFFQGPKQFFYNFFTIRSIVKNCVLTCDLAILRIPSTVAFTVLNYVKKQNIPYAVEVVFNPFEAAIQEKNFMISFFMRMIHYKQVSACRHADGASYVTQFNLQKIYPAIKSRHLQSYYSSVELPNSFYGKPRSFTKDKIFIICHVSNPIKAFHKGHIAVIDTIKLLKDKGLNVIAHFAGDGELVPFFENYAKEVGVEESIKFVGLLKQKELREFLLNSDLMLFPSKSEGLPRVLIEAMATGLPCVSTRIAGIPELISDELTFDPDDSRGFANKISEIINTPARYEELSNSAFEKAKEYEVEVLNSRRFKFYSELKKLINYNI